MTLVDIISHPNVTGQWNNISALFFTLVSKIKSVMNKRLSEDVHMQAPKTPPRYVQQASVREALLLLL